MRKYAIIYLVCIGMFQPAKSQIFTNGGASQMYWNWRPDIADSCYEFTFVNTNSTIQDPVLPNLYQPMISLFYWNDCNYGKNYMSVNDTGFINSPLWDTLFRITNHFGIVDTFCGFDSPWEKGQSINKGTETTSPHRKMSIYRGLIYLPEKCKNWHFAIGNSASIGGLPWAYALSSHYYCNGTYGGSPPTYTNVLSNIDSLTYFVYTGNQRKLLTIQGIIGCTFNTLDFSKNSSPRFLSPPVYYYPIQQEVEYNPGAYDPDHDSVVISIGDTIKSCNWLLSAPWPFFKALDSAGNTNPDVFTHNHYYAPLPGQIGPNPIRYNSQNNPFDTDSSFHLNDSTGRTTFTAQSAMEPTIYYKATEFRDHKFVSETYFINQFTLINDNRPASYIQIDTASIQGTLMFNNQNILLGCVGYPISFDAYVKLPGVLNGNLIVRTTADSTLPGNGSCIVSGSNSDSVHLAFSWTPPANARGLYNVYVSAKDSNCTPPYNHYLQVYTFSFYIDTCSIPMNISNADKDDHIILFPNPASGNLTISLSQNFSSVKIFTLLSELVFEEKTKSTKQLEVNVKNFPAGIYLVDVDGKWMRKLVIEK